MKKILSILFVLFLTTSLFAETRIISTKNFAKKTINNNFTTGQTINGTVTVNSLVNLSTVHGQWYVTYNAVTFVPSQAYTTYNVGLVVQDGATNCTVGTDGGVTLSVTGFYRVNCEVNILKGTGGDDIEGGISINGAEPDYQNEFRDDNTTVGFNYSGCTLYRYLNAGDRLNLKIKNLTSNTRSITLRSSKFDVKCN